MRGAVRTRGAWRHWRRSTRWRTSCIWPRRAMPGACSTLTPDPSLRSDPWPSARRAAGVKLADQSGGRQLDAFPFGAGHEFWGGSPARWRAKRAWAQHRGTPTNFANPDTLQPNAANSARILLSFAEEGELRPLLAESQLHTCLPPNRLPVPRSPHQVLRPLARRRQPTSARFRTPFKHAFFQLRTVYSDAPPGEMPPPPSTQGAPRSAPPEPSSG